MFGVIFTVLLITTVSAIGKILFERRFGGLSDHRDPSFQEFIDAVRAMFICTAKLMPYPIWFSKLFKRKLYREHNQNWDIIFKVGMDRAAQSTCSSIVIDHLGFYDENLSF